MLQWVGRHRSDALDRVARQVTALGNTATLAVLVLWLGAAFWAAGRPRAGWILALSFAGGRALNEGLKALFARPRPDVFEWGTEVASASFPSAHAMSAAIVYGTAAYLVASPLGRGARLLIWAGAALLVLGVAMSRVALGVHYPGDVIAGVVAGVIWSTVFLAVLGRARRRLPG